MSKSYSHKAMMAQLHIAPKELGMDEDTRRDFIAARFKGKRSSKDLTFNEKFALLQAFKDAGWKPKKKRGTKQNIPGAHKTYYTDKQSRYMIALWNHLYDFGAVKNKDNSGKKLSANEAMERWIANQVNKPGQEIPKKRNPDTLHYSDKNRLVEALKDWISRVNPEFYDKHLLSIRS